MNWMQQIMKKKSNISIKIIHFIKRGLCKMIQIVQNHVLLQVNLMHSCTAFLTKPHASKNTVICNNLKCLQNR